ncbi:MAG: hypothetical protein J0I07_07730, partial [Myxococcales bacterium]|nr:hypothetical protein [Myxococcales bacterium]
MIRRPGAVLALLTGLNLLNYLDRLVVSAVLLAIFPKGFPNYDTIYYLLWGREIADGLSPDYGAPLAPTPHPLYDLLGAVFSPLGDGSITVAVVLAYVSLGLLAWLVYRLGKE